MVAHFNSSVSLVYRLVNFSTPRSTRASLGALAHHAPQDDHPDAFARVMAQITTPLGRQRPPLHMSPGDNRSVVQSVLSGLSNGPMAKDYRENIHLHPLWLRRTVFTVLVLSNRTANGLPPLPSEMWFKIVTLIWFASGRHGRRRRAEIRLPVQADGGQQDNDAPSWSGVARGTEYMTARAVLNGKSRVSVREAVAALIYAASQSGDHPAPTALLRLPGTGAFTNIHGLRLATVIAGVVALLDDVEFPEARATGTKARTGSTAQAVEQAARAAVSISDSVRIGPGSAAETEITMMLVNVLLYVHVLYEAGATGAYNFDWLDGTAPDALTSPASRSAAVDPSVSAEERATVIALFGGIPSEADGAWFAGNLGADVGHLVSAGVREAVCAIAMPSRPDLHFRGLQLLTMVTIRYLTQSLQSVYATVESFDATTGNSPLSAYVAALVANDSAYPAAGGSGGHLRNMCVEWGGSDEMRPQVAALEVAIKVYDQALDVLKQRDSLSELTGLLGQKWVDANTEVWLHTTVALVTLAALLMAAGTFPDAAAAIRAVGGDLVPSWFEREASFRKSRVGLQDVLSSKLECARRFVADAVYKLASDVSGGPEYKDALAAAVWPVRLTVNPNVDGDAHAAMEESGDSLSIFSSTELWDTYNSPHDLTEAETAAAKRACRRSLVVKRIYEHSLNSQYICDRITFAMVLVAGSFACVKCWKPVVGAGASDSACGCGSGECTLRMCQDCTGGVGSGVVPTRHMCQFKSHVAGAGASTSTDAIPAYARTNDDDVFVVVASTRTSSSSSSSGSGGGGGGSSSGGGGGSSSGGGGGSGGGSSNSNSSSSSSALPSASGAPRTVPTAARLAGSPLGVLILAHLRDLSEGTGSSNERALDGFVETIGHINGLETATLNELAALAAACLHTAAGRGSSAISEFDSMDPATGDGD